MAGRTPGEFGDDNRSLLSSLQYSHSYNSDQDEAKVNTIHA